MRSNECSQQRLCTSTNVLFTKIQKNRDRWRSETRQIKKKHNGRTQWLFAEGGGGLCPDISGKEGKENKIVSHRRHAHLLGGV